MNYLFHLFLSDPKPQVQLGNLMGDFVKGRLTGLDYPQPMLHGIRQHRRVDSFAGSSSSFQQSRLRIDPRFGYFRAIMVDVFYDHILARDWTQHHPLSLEQFAEQIYAHLENHFDQLPPGLKAIAPRMIRHNWLVSYRDPEIVERVLIRLDQRVSRPTPLPQGLPQLLQNYDALAGDCAEFIIEARGHLHELSGD